MKKKILLLLAIGLFLLVLSGLLSIPQIMRQSDPKAFENSARCDQVKAGVAVSELYQIFGDPIGEDKIEDEIWVFFRTNPATKGAISAKINKETGQVLLLKCLANQEPNWDLSKK